MIKRALLTLAALTLATAAQAQNIWSPVEGVQIALPDGYVVDLDTVATLSGDEGTTRALAAGPATLDSLRDKGFGDEILSHGWRALDPTSDFPALLDCTAAPVAGGGQHPLCGPAFMLRMRVLPYGDGSSVAVLRQHLNLDPAAGNAAIEARDFDTLMARVCTTQGFDTYENLAARSDRTATCTSTRNEVENYDMPGGTKVWLLQDHGVLVNVFDITLLMEAMIAVLPADGSIPDADVTTNDPFEQDLAAEMLKRAEDHDDLLAFIDQIIVTEN